MQSTINVITADRIGVVSEIAGVLDSMKMNILSSRASVKKARDGITEISDFTAVVEYDSENINDHYIKKKLFRIRGVKKVNIQ